MAKKQAQETEDAPIEFERMPGSEALEQPEGLDLNFGLGEEEQQNQEVDESAVVEEEPPVEKETTQETEEVSAESEESVETEEPQEETVAEQSQEAEPTEAEEQAKEPEPPKKPMVPKTRLDEVLQKNKAMQKELEEMKAKEEAPKEAPKYDFDSEEVKLQNLILDGQAEAAAKKRAEIRAAERDQITYEVEQKMRQEIQVSNQQNAILDASKQIEAEFPVFDQNSEHFNEQLTNEVIELAEAFGSKGYDGADAMHKAVKYVISANNLGESAVEATPKEALSPKKAQSTVDEVAKKRSEVAKKLKTADQQPPNLPGESSSSHGEQPLDISNMSEEEFDALPPATIARLRGDTF
jgi:hypothetical protein